MSSSSSIFSSEDTALSITPGDIVTSQDGEVSFTILTQIGTGRCCLVYSGSNARDGSLVALKFFRQGSDYEGAIQRERYVLDTFSGPHHNIVHCYACLTYHGLHCLVLELLGDDIDQVIFKNDNQGLSLWATVKFARDVLTTLQSLHQAGLVHGDLKPANILWSSQSGIFKCIDFSLTFNTKEKDIHQIQSEGYRSPEAAEWNRNKEDQKHRRRRLLRGTFTRLDIACPPFSKESDSPEYGDINMPDLDQIKDEKLTGNDSEVSGEMFREPRCNDYELGI